MKYASNVKYLAEKSCVECEVARACGSCLKRITQIEYYTTEIIILKRLLKTSSDICYFIIKRTEIDKKKEFRLIIFA